MPTLVANCRTGLFYALGYSTGTVLSSSYPYFPSAGPANAGLAFDGTYAYLPGIYNGVTVQMGVVETASSPSEPTSTPVVMPSPAFRPTVALFDPITSRAYVADYPSAVTAWESSTGSSPFQLAANFPIVPATLASVTPGPINAQGLALNPNGSAPILYTCFQSGAGTDYLATIQSLAESPTVTANALNTAGKMAYLTTSNTGIGYDTQSGYLCISTNNPQGGCLTVLQTATGYPALSPSPLSTLAASAGTGANADARGVCCLQPVSGSTLSFIFVCNFATNSLAIFQNNSGALSQLSNSPVPTLPSPNAVAAYYDSSSGLVYVYLAHLNGLSGGLSIFSFEPSSPTSTWTLVGTFLPNVQLISVAVA